VIHTEQLAEGVWLFRYIPEGEYGDPYTFVCVGVAERGVIRLKGAMGDFDSTVWNAMYESISKLGFRKFTARRNGELITRRVKPTRKDKDYE
jgi:hypothetical protein